MRKILVIRFSSLGDVALTIPTLLSITRTYPKVQIVFLTKKSFLPLFENITNISFVGLDLNDYKGLLGIFKLFLYVKKFGPYEKIIDLHSSLRSILLRFFFLKTSSYAFNKNRKVKKMQVREKNKILKEQPHISYQYMSVFKKAGLKSEMTHSPWIKSSTKMKEEVELILKKYNLDCKKNHFIGFAPFAAHKLKEFSSKKKEEIVKQISISIPNCSLFLLGSPLDKDKMLKLKKELKNVYLCCEIVDSFSLELALIEKMNLVLSMDSGNLHLASLLNIPVLGFYGTTHPYSGFYPFGKKHQILQKNLDCRPCSIYGNTNCRKKTNECLEDISIQEIINKILVMIQK